MRLTGKAAKTGRFYLEFCERFLGNNFKATCALETDSDSPRIFTLNDFQSYALMASGAQWICDTKGNWQLVEANGMELEFVVIELLDYLWVPALVPCAERLKHCVRIPQMAALLKLRMGLNMESLKCTQCSERECCKTGSHTSRHEQIAEAENSN